MDKIKKESRREFVVINEEKLISEVERRPILYDKALKGYRKPSTRETSWQEVASSLENTVDECKKRWRSLRDAFMKQYKIHSHEPANTKKRWVYYEQMEFLAPFLENNDESLNSIGNEYVETLVSDSDINDKNAMSQQIIYANNGEHEYSTQIELDEYTEEQLEEEALETSQYRTVPIKKQENSSIYYITTTPNRSLKNNEMQPSTSNQQMKLMQQPNVSTTYVDSDEQFLLSCLPILKRLSIRKNAMARLKIQELLFEIEFDAYDGHQ